MPRRKLFLSHSSKTPENRALLKDLCGRLGADGAGYHVLIDQGGEIYAGADWELRLNEWLAECQAAVILFSNAALNTSDWVKKEAAILTWRREVEEGFTLIPVLLDGLAQEELATGLFRTLRINKSQCIHCDATPAEIAARISEGLGDPRAAAPRTPFEAMEGIIARILARHADAEALEVAWNCLAATNKAPWTRGARERFAAALARHLLRNGCEALEELRALLDNIRPKVAQEHALELLEYLAAVWVPAEAAGGIPAARHGSHLVALNGLYTDFTARCYMHRAWPLSGLPRLVPVSNRTQTGIQEDIRADFRRNCPHMKAEDLDRRANNPKNPLLILLPQPDEDGQLPDAELLDALREEYPHALFIVPTGPKIPDGIAQTLDARPLLPALDLQIEKRQHDQYWDTRDFIDRLGGF